MKTPKSNSTNRRTFLQLGCSGFLGLGLEGWINPGVRANSKVRNPKAVILVFQTGAPSHIDTLDPKPDAPGEIRGEFGVAKTSIPGVLFGEHLPQMAARANKMTIVRNFTHKDNNHTAATHHVITGSLQPGVRFDKPLSRDDWPCYGAGTAYLAPPPEGIPASVTLPTFLGDGPLVWPGQHAGFLGPKYDPWQIKSDPNKKNFKVDHVDLPAGLTVGQLENRVALLDALGASQEQMARSVEGKRLSDQQKKAVAVLSSGAVARAFDLKSEPERNRERYGRHMFGQSMLLAKRLVNAGVRVVQANMGPVQNWDSHGENFNRLKRDLLPPLDKGVAALLDDLSETGLIEDVMVVVMGEFGRTPKIDSKNAGRDHWAACFSGAFFGGGVQQGQVLGQSDKSGAYPLTVGYSPDDLGATIYHVLGIDPTTEIRDRQDRPVQLNRGTIMQGLFAKA